MIFRSYMFGSKLLNNREERMHDTRTFEKEYISGLS